MSYRADIDGLRAIAILAVLCFHFELGFHGGYAGVDIFFVISGFLIAGSSLHELRTFADVGIFYRRRIARVFPMAALTCAACAVIAPFVYSPKALRDAMAAALPAALFFGNFYFWQTHDYFSSAKSLNPFLHLWSLAIEEQFYLLFPFLLLWARRPRLFISVLTLVSMIAMTYEKPTGAFYLLPSRMWEFCIGIFLALTNRRLSSPAATCASTLGACIVIAAILFLPAGEIISPYWRLAPAVGSALIIWGGTTPNILSERILGNTTLSYLGRLSFSAYLIHWPIWTFLNYKYPLLDRTTTGAMLVPIIFILAFILYRFIEKPAQKYLRAQPLMKSGAFGLGLLSAAALTVVAVSRFYHIENSISGIPLRNYTDLYELSRCFLNADQPIEQYDITGCDGNLAISSPKIMIWGDSMAAHLLPGLKQNELLTNDSVFQATAATCSPLHFETASPWCARFNHLVVNTVLPRSKPNLVVLASKWVRDYETLGEAGLTKSLEKRFRLLAKRNIAVLLVGQGPNFLKELSELIRVGSSDALYLPAKDFRILNSLLRSVAARNNVSFVDPAAEFCRVNECMEVENGIPLFWDYAHLTAQGSKRLSKFIAPEILRRLARSAVDAASIMDSRTDGQSIKKAVGLNRLQFEKPSR